MNAVNQFIHREHIDHPLGHGNSTFNHSEEAICPIPISLTDIYICIYRESNHFSMEFISNSLLE